MKNIKFALFLVCCLTGLSACQTLQNVRDDIEDIIANDYKPPTLGRSEPLLESPCPQVELVDDLSSISDFKNPNKAFKENLISRVDLKSAESTCKLSSNSAVVDLNLVFKGKLGPKGRHKSSDKPFFSYPFFIAITNPSGRIMAKEIFAASMTYKSHENSHHYIETLRHIIPISSKNQAKNYKVMIGFQVTPDQLKYNRDNMVPTSKSKKLLKDAGINN